MNAEANPGEHPEIRRLVKRYASLRAAVRALAGSTRLTGGLELEDDFARVRSAARELALSDPGSAATRAALCEIDRQLDALGRDILSAAQSVPLPQLRATLPRVREQHPEEVCALLHTCLAPGVSPADCWELLDYLITLLAAEDDGHRKVVARAPTALTPQLAEACARAAEQGQQGAEPAARAFRKACAEVEGGEPLPPVVARMRAWKRESAALLLVPEVLEAVIAYNVAIWNCFSELVETERTLDESELLAPGPEVERGEWEQAPPAADCAIDTELGAVEQALVGAMRNDPASDPALSSLVAGFDLERLTPFERGTFSAVAGDESAAVARSVLTLGLLLRHPESVDGALAIPLETLRGSCVEQADMRVRAAIRRCMAAERYDDARRLAEIRTKFLQGRRAGPLATGAAHAQFETRSATAPPRAFASTRARGRRGIAVAGALAGVCAAAVLLATGQPTSNVQIYSATRLAAISPYLESGYRDGYGEGSLFIGTLSDEWHRLPRARHAELGGEIAGGLDLEGVREVMLFDRRRALAAHFARGRLQFPASRDLN